MERKGLVRRFGSYTLQQMEMMKRDLEIRMPMNRLAFCASYYRNTEKRDPSIEELQFIDLLTQGAEVALPSMAPSELLTNDAFIAETYADMMNKRRAVWSNTVAPCTLSEMTVLANTYLERVGKDLSHAEYLCSIEKRNTPYAKFGTDTVCAPNASTGLRVLHRSAGASCAGDLLLLLRPYVHTPLEESNLDSLLASPQGACVKHLRRVGSQGLFIELLSMVSCATLEPDRLATAGEPIPLSMLISAYHGDVIVRISRDGYADFAKTAYELGIRVSPFATVGHGTRIRILRSRGQSFSLESQFLRSLFPAMPFSARLENEHTDVETPIDHAPACTPGCAYLHTDSIVHEPQTASIDSFLIASASVAPKQSFFRNALDTVLAAVTTLAVSGCDYPDQRLAISLELPERTSSATELGAGVSSILGIYRAQAELAIPAASVKLDHNSALSTPVLQVFSTAKGTPCPTGFTAAGNNVYCLAPATRPDGLPDFNNLRLLLTRLTVLRNRGVIRSARVFCHEAVTDVLRSMTDENFGCLTSGKELIAADVLPLGVLVECSDTLDATKIGTVTAREPIASIAEEHKLPTTNRILTTPKPEVLLLCAQRDGDATTLATTLRNEGAQVTQLYAETFDVSEFSRRLLTAGTLILCGITLPEDPTVFFALDTMKRAGGRVLLLGGARGMSAENEIELPNGIYSEMIAQICEK